MTTKKAIELIRKDVEHYKKLVAIVDESKNKFLKKYNFDNSPSDSMLVMMKEIMLDMYEMLLSLYEDQIKWYEDILIDLKSTRKHVI